MGRSGSRVGRRRGGRLAGAHESSFCPRHHQARCLAPALHWPYTVPCRRTKLASSSSWPARCLVPLNSPGLTPYPAGLRSLYCLWVLLRPHHCRPAHPSLLGLNCQHARRRKPLPRLFVIPPPSSSPAGWNDGQHSVLFGSVFSPCPHCLNASPSPQPATVVASRPTTLDAWPVYKRKATCCATCRRNMRVPGANTRGSRPGSSARLLRHPLRK